jgi:hypothetical protein
MTVSYMDECPVYESAVAAFGSRDLARSFAPADATGYLMTSSMPHWLDRAGVRLYQFGKLPENWDSYGAKPVSAAARNAAFHLLGGLSSPSTPEPILVPTSDGSVQIEWHTGGIDLEVRILSSTRISIAFEDLTGEHDPIEDELQFDLTRLRDAIEALSMR